MGPGQAELMIVGKDAEKVRAALKGSGATLTERTGFYTKGPDKLGALLGTYESLADAGINLDAANALAVGGKYGSYIWVREEDAARAEAALAKKG